MSDPNTNEAMSRVVTAIRREMDAAGTEVLAVLKQRLSVPVGKQGKRIIRSKPGEYPRRETGRLVGSTKKTVTHAERDKVVLKVTTDTPYDEFLDKGTSRMAARPMKAPTEKVGEEIVTRRLTAAAKTIT